MTIRAYIGIGSNLDNPVAQVLEAVEELEMIPVPSWLRAPASTVAGPWDRRSCPIM